MTKKPKLLFYVQHLLGIGHLKRATTLARSMNSVGFDITLVSGGKFVPVIDKGGMKFIQLPEVRAADRKFSGLVEEDGSPLSNQTKQIRIETLVTAFERIKPDMLLVEMFPFGRRMLEFEIIPLLERATSSNPRPLIVSSVRDILVEKVETKRTNHMVKMSKKYFDKILVHGDPQFISFDKTFPKAFQISDLLSYTGYVVELDKINIESGGVGKGEVIVSSGSGAVGELILETAIRVRPHTYLSNSTWRLLAGHYMDTKKFKEIKDLAPDGIIVERARPDFIQLLKNCSLSISQGGYNTVMEVLACGANGIAIPYGGGKETEQTLRAKLLEDRGLIKQISEEKLSDKWLIEAINQTKNWQNNKQNNLNINGAKNTANLLASLVFK